MPQSLTVVYLHIVFSTKNRSPYLTDKGLRAAMHAYLAGTFEGLGSPARVVGGVDDHVHALCRFGRTLSIAELLKEAKRAGTGWAREQRPELSDFRWQAGYGAFSVSPGDVDEVVAYIRDQEEHHRKDSFQDEFRRLLRAHGIEWDERYVWD